MRLFVGIRPAEAALDHLDAAVEPLRVAHPGLRWIPRERWHVTVAFLGETDDRRLPGLTARFDRAAARHSSMMLSFAGAGRFGRQVLWCGLAGEVEALRRLAASVAAAARRTGVAMEDRPYRAHLTLARNRDGSSRDGGNRGGCSRGGSSQGGTDLRVPVSALEGYVGPAWVVGDVELVESELGAQPRYTVRHRAALGALGGGTGQDG